MHLKRQLIWFMQFHSQLSSLVDRACQGYCVNMNCFKCLLKRARLLSLEIKNHHSSSDEWTENIYENDKGSSDSRQKINTDELNLLLLLSFKSIVHYGDNIGAKSVRCVITENNFDSHSLLNQDYEVYQVMDLFLFFNLILND